MLRRRKLGGQTLFPDWAVNPRAVGWSLDSHVYPDMVQVRRVAENEVSSVDELGKPFTFRNVYVVPGVGEVETGYTVADSGRMASGSISCTTAERIATELRSARQLALLTPEADPYKVGTYFQEMDKLVHATLCGILIAWVLDQAAKGVIVSDPFARLLLEESNAHKGQPLPTIVPGWDGDLRDADTFGSV